MRLHAVLDYQARERPTAEFAVYGDQRLTYREALAEVHQLSHALVSAGLQIGDRRSRQLGRLDEDQEPRSP